MAAPLLLAAGGSALAGGVLNFVGQQKLRQQARKTLQGLETLQNNYNQGAIDLQAFIEDSPELNIDRSLYGDLVSFAREEAIRSEGRATGAEQIGDSIRQNTANATARALNVAGSGADALGAISTIQGQENSAFNQADIALIQQRNQQIQRSKDRLFQATRANAMFNQKADLMEFQSRQQQRNQLTNFKSGQLNQQYQMGLQTLGQQGAVASADAAMLGSVGQTFGTASSSLLGMYGQEQALEAFIQMNSPATTSTVPASNSQQLQAMGIPLNPDDPTSSILQRG